MSASQVQKTTATGVNATSITTPAFGSATTVNNILFALAANGYNVAGKTLTFSDSKSNTWTTDKQTNLTQSNNGGYSAIGSATISTGGSSHTVSATLSSAPTTGWQLVAAEWSGMTKTVDQSASNTAGNSTTSLTVTTSATTNANDVLFMVFQGDTNSTSTGVTKPTVNSSSTGVTSLANTPATTICAIDADYLILSSTGTQAVKWTYSSDSTGGYTGVAVAYKQSAGGPVSVNLAGQAITSAEGAITGALAYSATGQAITSSEGAPTPGVSYSVTGQSIASSEGAITASWSGSATLAGQAITSALGTITPTVSYAAAGQAITSTEGALTATVSYGLGGQSITSSEGAITASTGGNVTLSLGGQSLTSALGALSPAIGLTVTGQSVTSTEGTPGAEVDYSLSGQAITSSEGAITAQAGGDVTLSLGGQSAQFTLGTITISGQDVPVVTTAETPAGRPRRIRDIYRVRIDGQVFEFRTLQEALQFLERAKTAAHMLAQDKMREATELQAQSAKPLPPPVIKVPKIEISSRELRAAASATRREIEVIYEAAIRDAEIAMLMELNKRAEEDDEALMILM